MMDHFLKCLTLTILLSVHVSYTSAELTEFLYMYIVLKEVQCLAHFMGEGTVTGKNTPIILSFHMFVLTII